MAENQMEFDFMKDIQEDYDSDKSFMDEICEEAKKDFVMLMEKYGVSDEDSKTIWVTANQFPC